jgi:hypothetical protein
MGRTKSSETEPSSGDQAGKRTAKKATNSESSGHSRRKREPGEVVLLTSKAEYARYESIDVRQKAVERAKRSIYAHLHEITNAHINLSVGKGNVQSAKFLFEFAGIDDFPTALALSESQPDPRNTSSGQPCEEDPSKAVLAFYDKLGVTPPVKVKKSGVEKPEKADEALAVV